MGKCVMGMFGIEGWKIEFSVPGLETVSLCAEKLNLNRNFCNLIKYSFSIAKQTLKVLINITCEQ